jgi:cytochrome c oxidase assembly protein subunit 15
MYRLLKWLGVLTSCGMFVVLVMGALVTNTGSGHGCANTWPLCRGQFIPEFAVGTFIEFSHRAVTGVVSLLVFALAAGVWLRYRRRREVQVLVPLMIVFLLLQAVLGAIAAGTHETPAVLALHFGVSLISFASIVLATAFIWESEGADAARDLPVPAALRWLILGTLLYTYAVVYLGAYVRHSGASLACLDWPLCNGALFPGFQWAVFTQFIHRAAAGLLVLLIVALWLAARRDRATRPDLYRGSVAALVSVLLQSASGALLIFARLELFTTLLHAALVSLLFTSLCYTAYHLVPRRVCLPRQPSPVPAPSDAVRAGAK